MNPIERIYNSIEQVVINRVSNSRLFGEYYKRTDKASPIDWSKQPQNYTAKTIEDWMSAVLAATNPDDPRRGLLMRFFNSLKLDLHLMSCVDNRILPIQCAPFKLVDKSNTENTDAHKLFERPWYLDIVKIICMHTYEGTKLIEMIKLNDKLELAEVREIPQSNFLPERGLILKEEYDNKGVEYKTGVYANYYVQIGNDYTLGLFNEIAMIVLAKKLGLGSWMSYIAKYGVPPLFIITDRMDDTRLKELHKMAMSFRSNHFVILNGNEKVELPKDSNTDGYQSFSNLNAFANSELSKRINGGTGVSDEKSFVGSAELHERMLQYRIKVDKLILKFYMNEEIIPRLVKLSSVYAPLANLTFDWDDSESLTLKEKIEAVKDLAQYFDFDPEELAKLTGLPITTVKETIKKVEEAQKKKPNASVKGARKYSLAPFAYRSPSPNGEGFGVRSATWDAAISRLADQIWNGEVSPSDLDRDLVLKNYASLSKAAETAWGDGYYTDAITRKMRDNLMSFAGAKSYNTMSVLNDLRKTVANKESFISEAKLIINKHNETWLNTEAKFAANKTSTAKDFKQYLNDVDIYPNLKVRTMQDENVRETHAANEGVVMPVNNVKYAPPFDPGCRCWLEQTTDPVTKHGLTNINPKWATNPYPEGHLFSEQSSYHQSITTKDKTSVHNNIEKAKLLVTSINSSNYPDKLHISPFAQFEELKENTDTAELLLKNHTDISIKVRAHITITGEKNPEYELNKKLADAKRIKGYNGISNGFVSAIEQKCRFVIIDFNKHFDISKPLDTKKIASKLKNRRLNFENGDIDGCYLAFGERSVYVGRDNFKKKLSDNETKDMILNLIKGLTAQ